MLPTVHHGTCSRATPDGVGRALILRLDDLAPVLCGDLPGRAERCDGVLQRDEELELELLRDALWAHPDDALVPADDVVVDPEPQKVYFK